MNLRPINPKDPRFTFQCRRCGGASDSHSGYADLDGDPFRAYYCRTCAVRCEHPGCHVPATRGGSCGNHESDR